MNLDFLWFYRFLRLFAFWWIRVHPVLKLIFISYWLSDPLLSLISLSHLVRFLPIKWILLIKILVRFHFQAVLSQAPHVLFDYKFALHFYWVFLLFEIHFIPSVLLISERVYQLSQGYHSFRLKYFALSSSKLSADSLDVGVSPGISDCDHLWRLFRSPQDDHSIERFFK